MSRYQMPEITIPANFSEADRAIAALILNKGKLRASKPKASGEAAYVWRMVAFIASPISQHHCMPMTAEFDLPEQFWGPREMPERFGSKNDPAAYRAWHDSDEYRAATDIARERRRTRVKELQAIADALLETIPKRQWRGALRWARAFGSTTSVEGL